ncbi:hypothetical protein Bca4012_024828 [Brassica carinata]
MSESARSMYMGSPVPYWGVSVPCVWERPFHVYGNVRSLPGIARFMMPGSSDLRQFSDLRHISTLKNVQHTIHKLSNQTDCCLLELTTKESLRQTGFSSIPSLALLNMLCICLELNERPKPRIIFKRGSPHLLWTWFTQTEG